MDLKDKITEIKYYSGMRTIGGTYIEVKYKNDRVIFDCGSIFDPNIEDNSNLEYILDHELAPYIEGIYDGNDKLNTAFCVSHIHLDHTKMINYIHESIPIYVSEDTKRLLESVNVNDDFMFSNDNIDKTTRELLPVKYNETINIGDIKVQFIRVDHDGYGACGFLIETPDYKIAYTGDIRLHGYLYDESINFIERAKNSDLLIIEGVSVSFDEDEKEDDEYEKITTEKELIDKFIDLEKENDNRTIIFNYYITNLERIINIINNSKRKVVLDEFNAFVLYKTTGFMPYFYSFTNNKYNLDEKYLISVDHLLDSSKDYLIQADESLDYFIENVEKNSIYIHSDAIPLGEFDPEYNIFLEKFKNYDINFKLLKCSGHAHPKDLEWIIDQINPKLLTPIHSYRPEMLYNKNGKTIYPKKNEVI